MSFGSYLPVATLLPLQKACNLQRKGVECWANLSVAAIRLNIPRLMGAMEPQICVACNPKFGLTLQRHSLYRARVF